MTITEEQIEVPTVEDLIQQFLLDVKAHEVGEYLKSEWVVDRLLDLKSAASN